jgi:DNA polymerase-1
MLYLIDGHALAYRTYFALNPSGTTDARWLTSSGEPTAGVYGFASVLMRILEQDKPDYIAVAFDTGKTFRHDIFPEYKGTRAKMPDDLRTQMERIRQLVDAFNIPRLEVETFEADDILGTIARQAEEKGLGVKIITGDRDLLQLVNERVIVNLAGSKLSEAKDYTPEGVLAYLGVRPDQVVDYKAMVGDKSDNIPGVAGVGEKTAIDLLQKYDTLDSIYAHLAELKPGVKAKLETDHNTAYLSQDLARIRVDVPVKLDLESARAVDFDVTKVEDLFRQLEFRTLMPRVTALGSKSRPRPPAQQLNLFNEPVEVLGEAPTYELNTRVIDTPEALADLVKALNAAPIIALDTETTSTDPMQAQLVGISLAVQPGEGYYIPVGHRDGKSPQLPLQQVIEALRGPLQNPDLPKAGHNLKYDALVLKRHGLEIIPLSFDTMLAEWLVNPASHNLGLKNLAWVRLGIGMTHIEELIGKGKTQLNMADVAVASAAPYAAADAEVTLRLVPVLDKDLRDHHALDLFHTMEMPLVKVLMEMEQAGIMVDRPFFERFAVELRDRLTTIEDQIYQIAGSPFNLNSTQQLSRVLFDNLKLPPPNLGKKTTAGTYSTSADVLDEMRGQHPVVDLILEYRELSKIKSTYVDALPLQINPATGRIHTSYNQTGSVTGRIASSDPNLQNIPTRTETGRRVREGFVASPGMVLLSVDYSQIELRIVAHMANDQSMLAAFKAGQDIHAATAAAIYNVTLDQVSKDMRRHAKAINFGLIYGMGAFGLSRSADLTLAEAENFIKEYFTEFPGVKSYLDGIRRQAAEIGYVETLLGRRRYFPGLKNQTNQNMRQREEREAINAPIQGTAADIIKLAMLRIPDAIQKSGLHATMLLQVHDELVLEVRKEELDAAAHLVQDEMEHAFTLQIPLTTEAKSGVHWGDMQVLKL